ncbi:MULTISPECIES: DUF3168 domain-containing protein [Eubacterium]|uniref:Gp10 protein n=1 Tax=Eubacterium barkeri TaxID=1528 RepID=A0A1H3BJF9_EUBBA|nr:MULTISPECIES: DUF3168 domain-containing protein [Eubacterium]MEA5073093.1 DUF3168 domain-containing protein [Eubacterium aggregans]SDX42066.1 Protein of unknown function [Eubacterium barkeri]
MTLSDLIYKLTEDIPNIFESWYRQELDKTHGVFQQISEEPQVYADGYYDSVEHTYRFDVFSSSIDEADAVMKKIRAALESGGFIWQGTQFEYLSEIDYYHNSQKFLILTEENNG